MKRSGKLSSRRYSTSSVASAASVISMEWDKWTDLDDIGVVGVGSGLTWAGYWVRFTA